MSVRRDSHTRVDAYRRSSATLESTLARASVLCSVNVLANVVTRSPSLLRCECIFARGDRQATVLIRLSEPYMLCAAHTDFARYKLSLFRPAHFLPPNSTVNPPYGTYAVRRRRERSPTYVPSLDTAARHALLRPSGGPTAHQFSDVTSTMHTQRCHRNLASVWRECHKLFACTSIHISLSR